MQLDAKFFNLILAATLIFFSKIINASLISNIDTETVSYEINASGYTWTASYDIGFVNQNLLIDVDVFLTGDDPSNELLNIWEQGIENIWSSAFDIFDGNYYYDILFNVDWLSSVLNSDHTVNVNNGSGAVNLVEWYTDNPSNNGYSKQGDIAAHEFGHMLGLFDEYSAGALGPTGLIRANSIMGQNTSTPHIDHYDALISWASINSGALSLSLTSDQGNHFYHMPTDNQAEQFRVVPTPNLTMIFILAILSLCILGKKRSFNLIAQVHARQIVTG